MTAELERDFTTIIMPRCKCGTDMVGKVDAIGRIRFRCPKCVGVSKPQHRQPDETFMPQGLVRVARTVLPSIEPSQREVLPPIEPGQLRCQCCANGVIGRARFCGACASAGRNDALTPTTLSPTALRVLEAILTAVSTTGRAPSGRALARALNISEGTISYHLQGLEKKGYISRTREAGSTTCMLKVPPAEDAPRG